MLRYDWNVNSIEMGWEAEEYLTVQIWSIIYLQWCTIMSESGCVYTDSFENGSKRREEKRRRAIHMAAGLFA